MIKKLPLMTERERFDHLETLAVRLFQEKDLTQEELEWIAGGLLALCRGLNFNEAFMVSTVKKPDPKAHAIRFARVEYLRQQGLKKAAAIEAVAKSQNKSDETIESSWKFQQRIQNKFKKLIGK